MMSRYQKFNTQSLLSLYIYIYIYKFLAQENFNKTKNRGIICTDKSKTKKQIGGTLSSSAFSTEYTGIVSKVRISNHGVGGAQFEKIKTQLPRFPPNSSNRQRVSSYLLCQHNVGEYSEIAIAFKKASSCLDLVFYKTEKSYLNS